MPVSEGVGCGPFQVFIVICLLVKFTVFAVESAQNDRCLHISLPDPDRYPASFRHFDGSIAERHRLGEDAEQFPPGLLVEILAAGPVDCAIALEHVALAAAAEGLGTCWIGLGAHLRDQKILDEIGMPSDCRIVAPIIIGYPEGIPPASERHSPDILKII